MAFKLKNLKVKKVDFVDEGANPDAHITLFKRRDEDDNDTGEPDTKTIGAARKFFKFFSDLFEGEDSIDENDLAEAKRLAKETTAATENKAAIKPCVDKTQAAKKGDNMVIDKSKMTSDDLRLYEELEKKYGVVKGDEGEENTSEVNAEGDEGAANTASAASADTAAAASGENGEPEEDKDPDTEENGDVDKRKSEAIHPYVAAQLEELRKYKERAEYAEMLEIAKKYEILGKKPEELAKKLTTLKSTNEGAYDDMIAMLDESVEIAEKSGLFSEIGKSGHGGGSAEQIANAKATELLKSKHDLTFAQALREVLEADPELRERYEKED